MNPLLTVRNLETRFGVGKDAVNAVDGISFELQKGETLGLVGESGSGKSVTSLSLMRLIRAPGLIAGGEAIFQDHPHAVDLLKLSESQMRTYRGNRLAMIFQEPMTSLNPVFTCGYQVMEALQLHLNLSKSAARQRTLALFDQVKLADPGRVLRSYPHELSGGQKQRVMIAMAISCNPAILIADEPTTALDVTVQSSILQLMRELREERDMSMIFISHDLGVMAEIADRLAVMYQGKIVEQGTAEEIFRNPQHPYTRGLLACRPPLNRRLKRLPVVADFLNKTVSAENDTLLPDAALLRMEVSAEETALRREKLYRQEPLLVLKNICKNFESGGRFLSRKRSVVTAVNDVSLEVYPGETLGLVGESGCGKTTLGRTILRLLEPSSGEIFFEGQNLTRLPSEAMRKMRKEMQIIFQDPYSSLNPRMTVGQAIMEPMKVHGIGSGEAGRKDQTMQLLEKVGLEPRHFQRYPHEFSGGQRQRICIARALSMHPRFIICDESVSALDVSVQAQVLNLLMQLREEFGFTYIFISHDLSVVKLMSDRMVVMNQGSIEEMGWPEEVYAHPASAYTRKLIEAIPKGRLEDILQRKAAQTTHQAN